MTSKLHRRRHAAIRARPAGVGVAWLVFAIARCSRLRAPRRVAADEPVTLNFVNADIDAVVKAVAEITGRNFIIDPQGQGHDQHHFGPAGAAEPRLPDAALGAAPAGLRRGRGRRRGQDRARGRREAAGRARSRRARRRGGGDRLVTQVITLKYESAAQLVNVLRPLITPNNTIAAYPNGNALVITDYADNLKRIDRIIASLDQPPGGEPIVVPLRYASAIDIVPLLNRLLADAAAAGAPGVPADAQQRVTVIADPRSNAILVRADNPGRVARVRQLIEQLDTPGRPGGNMFIVYLKNAEAARVAQTLRAMLTGNAESGRLRGSTGLSPLPPSAMLGNAPARRRRCRRRAARRRPRRSRRRHRRRSRRAARRSPPTSRTTRS